MAKLSVCPKCFEPSPDVDAGVACPACGHSTEGARLLLRLTLALLLLVLVVSALTVLLTLGLAS